MELKLLLQKILLAATLIVISTTWGTHAAASQPAEYDAIRLPGNIVPLKYNLYLHPNLTDGRFHYSGNVNILIEAKEDTHSIVLHSLKLNHLVTTVNELPSNAAIPVRGTTMNVKHEQAIIYLGGKLSAGKQYLLTIFFSGELRSALRGFYRSTYKTKSGEERHIATTHFEPTGARLAFPCFDEPEMKATFRLHMVREGIHTALSNMPVEKEQVRADGLIVTTFQESVKMSTYLVAFVVCDFVSVSAKSSRGIRISVWTPKDQISQAQYAISIAPKIIDYYEKFFNVEFPLPKQDMIAIPDFGAGAMENWGLITYRLTAILYDPVESSAVNKQRVAVVIAHEMAHQWFGNLVTMKWWNDLWLNEGFAAFVEYIGTNHVEPSWKMMDQFCVANAENVMGLDSHNKSHPISVTVEDPADIGNLFDHITYLKGSSVIRMMADFLGFNNFVQGLTNYLDRFKYGNAEADDLWDQLSQVAPGKLNVKFIMDTWIKQMGYPVVSVKREGNEAILTQERFVSDVDGPADPKFQWNIPLTYKFQKAKDTKRRWFIGWHHKQKEVVIPWSKYLGWIKVNVDQVGFYRVNYEPENWKALATQLNQDHEIFSGGDRASLIDDAFNLANAGRVSQTQALELTEYLIKEKGYVPFQAATKSLGFIGGLLDAGPGSEAYGKYIMERIMPSVHRLGWKDTGSHLDKYLRSLVLNLAVKDNCKCTVPKAKNAFKAWMEKGTVIPANLRSIAYYAGIRYGGEKEWNFMFEKYKSCLYPSEKKTLMTALTYTADKTILKKYVDMMLDKDIIRPADLMFAINSVAKNPIGAELAYEFLDTKWDNELMARYKADFSTLGRMLAGVLSGGKTQAELDRATSFIARHEMGGAALVSKQVLATIRTQMKWKKNYEASVVAWLKSHV